MQNRIDKLFAGKKENVLSVFFTAGFPNLKDTALILESLEESEADLIEIGIPFSDPLADGPVIQQSSLVALGNGMTLNLLFQQLKDIRITTRKPVLLMGYLNSVMQFGIEKFYKQCAAVGIDGVILPDLPLEEYKLYHQRITETLNIKVVFLISVDTKPERIKQLDEASGGFLYLLSSNSTTGGVKGVSDLLQSKVAVVKASVTKNPLLIGFGIKGQKEFSEACEIANGAIIGSAFIELLTRSHNFKKDIAEFTSVVKTKLIKL
jgi:tryptophan synthase alpha chain